MIQSKNNSFGNNRNLGIEILRMILCFWVLSFHCLNNNKIGYFIYYITKTKFFHVPCFAFISFYYGNNIFIGRNIEKLKRRFERLLIPYILWPIIIFIIDNLLHFLFNHNIHRIYLYDLKIQLIVGRQFIVPLWYLFGTIFLSLSFFIISNIFKKYFLYVTQLLIIVSYIVQYSFKTTVFDIYKNNVKLPILDTFSIIPLSLFGINIAHLEILKYFKHNFRITFIITYILLFTLFKYEIFVDMGGYNGIIHIFISLLFFIGFYILPLENTQIWLQKIIKQLTSYTNGIYCLQTKIFPFVRLYIDNNGTIKSSLISYIILYFISFASIKIVGKTKLKYLFI